MLIFDLCVLLGKTRKELLIQVSRDELIKWAAYRRIKPFGYDVDAYRFGQLCATVHNASGKIFKKDAKWSDFFKPSYEMPKHTKAKPVDVLVSIFSAMAKTPEEIRKSDIKGK